MIGKDLSVRTRAAGALVAVLVLLKTAAPAQAAEASSWDGGPRSAVRLIAGTIASEAGAAFVRAGVEIRLGPGWKTYWRYPGDSGVPPRLRFDRSENVKAVGLRWPAPQSFTDEGGRSIGYKDRVILPLHVVPRDLKKPVMLRLDIDYAICEKLCVPVEAQAELELDGNARSLDAALAASEARVPTLVAVGERRGLAITAVAREDSGAKPRIIVDIAAPDDRDAELFVEGPSPDWALPIPAPVSGAPPGSRRFAFELDGLPPGTSAKGAVLTLTAVSGEAAIEATTRLD